MPLYEYRCRTCDTTFEVRRAMGDADGAVPCPDGHPNAVRLLSVFATTGRAAGSDAGAPSAAGVPCGGACVCHPH